MRWVNGQNKTGQQSARALLGLRGGLGWFLLRQPFPNTTGMGASVIHAWSSLRGARRMAKRRSNLVAACGKPIFSLMPTQCAKGAGKAKSLPTIE